MAKEKKDLADYQADQSGSKFLTLIAGLPLDAPLAIFGANSGAIVQGHIGKITKIDYESIARTANIPVLDADQVIVVDGQELVLAKKGEMPVAPTISWSTGRTMTLGLLSQGGDKTTVQFRDADGKLEAPIKSTDLNRETIMRLIGRTFKCAKFFRDDTNPITRNAGTKQERTYFANCFEFVEQA